MTRFTMAATVFVCLAFTPVGFVNAQSLKIGVIDLTRVVKEYHKFKSATNQLQDEAARVQQELNEMLEARKSLSEELSQLRSEIQDPLLNESLKQKKQAAFQKKYQESQAQVRQTDEFRLRRQRQLVDQQGRLFAGIRAEVVTVVRDKAKQEQYGLVLEKSAFGSTNVNGLTIPTLVYSDASFDFTNDVIAILNQTAPR